MKFKWLHIYGLSIIAVFVLGIFLFDLAGFWQTSGKVDADGKKVELTGKDPDDIKGWMTLDEVIKAYGLTLENLEEDFKVANLDPAKQLKDLAEETDEKISPNTLKEYLAGQGAAEK